MIRFGSRRSKSTIIIEKGWNWLRFPGGEIRFYGNECAYTEINIDWTINNPRKNVLLSDEPSVKNGSLLRFVMFFFLIIVHPLETMSSHRARLSLGASESLWFDIIICNFLHEDLQLVPEENKCPRSISLFTLHSRDYRWNNKLRLTGEFYLSSASNSCFRDILLFEKIKIYM